MAKHEFGIMESEPISRIRYDEYEPEKYGCISVDDEYIGLVADRLSPITCYWHTLDVCGKGLAYCGVTLIPPCSVDEFISAIEAEAGLSELLMLLKKARLDNKYVIHFGI